MALVSIRSFSPSVALTYFNSNRIKYRTWLYRCKTGMMMPSPCNLTHDYKPC
ncbi:hypothetical protein PAECIP111890_01572 [Paenibacillus sp. JJ-223]|nr:hypothetical protein PAECIP111890_01572 [Paenibacillus sp. JJ-223]